MKSFEFTSAWSLETHIELMCTKEIIYVTV